MKIFRAVSELEKIDLEIHGEFRAKRGAYEGKLFAESEKDASIFGRNFYIFDNEPIFLIEVEVNDIFAKTLGVEFPDQEIGVGSTISVDGDQLTEFNNNMTFKILDHVHC